MSSRSKDATQFATSTCRRGCGGFTLIELVITIAIISLVTALVMVRYASFNSATLLKNQAYEMALNLREAQVFAVGVRGDAEEFRNPYGIHFSTDENQYYLFVDGNDNGYDEGEEIGNPYAIDGRFEVAGICYNNCTVPLSAVSVLFKRPDFDAFFYGEGGSALNTTSIQVIIQPVNGSMTRTVEVWSTGQINVR